MSPTLQPKCQSCLAICRETHGRIIRQTRCTGPAIGTQCCPTRNHIVGPMALALVSISGSLLHYAWRCGTVWAAITQSFRAWHPIATASACRLAIRRCADLRRSAGPSTVRSAGREEREGIPTLRHNPCLFVQTAHFTGTRCELKASNSQARRRTPHLSIPVLDSLGHRGVT